jgi:Arc/MetJ-type ribon-helix-helix transcriptional regulator
MEAKSEYVTVRLPKELVDEIDHIVSSGLRGYKSRAEFIKEAVRVKLDEIKRLSESE